MKLLTTEFYTESILRLRKRDSAIVDMLIKALGPENYTPFHRSLNYQRGGVFMSNFFKVPLNVYDTSSPVILQFHPHGEEKAWVEFFEKQVMVDNDYNEILPKSRAISIFMDTPIVYSTTVTTRAWEMMRENPRLIHILFKYGANLNIKFPNGETYLHKLIPHNGEITNAGRLGEFVRALIDHGVDVNAINNRGETVFDKIMQITLNPYDENDFPDEMDSMIYVVKHLLDNGAILNQPEWIDKDSEIYKTVLTAPGIDIMKNTK